MPEGWSRFLIDSSANDFQNLHYKTTRLSRPIFGEGMNSISTILNSPRWSPKWNIATAAVLLLFWSAAAQAADAIKIGFSASLTGGLASSGKANLLAQQIWAEQINAQGGLLGRPVQLVFYDDQTNAATVPAIYAKLLDVDKVDLLMGAATNLIVAAMPQIMQRQKLVMVLVALGSNDEFRYPRYFKPPPGDPTRKV